MFELIIDYLLARPILSAAAIVVGFFIVSKLFVWIAEKIILRITLKTKTDLDDKIVAKVNNPISILLVLIGLYLGLKRIDATNILRSDIERNLFLVTDHVFASLVIFFVAMIIIRIVNILIGHFGAKFVKKTESNVDDQLLSIFQSAANVIFYFVAVMYILTLWGVDVKPYLASLGIVGIAIGLALQDSLKNIFGGLSIIIDGNIKVGDKIRLESNHVGIVDQISLRSTKIKTFDNEMMIIPNGLLANQRIHNYALPTPMNRVVVPFSVAYGTDVDKVQKTVLKTIASIENTIKDDPLPVVDFIAMGDSALKFEAKFWVAKYGDAYTAKLDATKKVYDALRKAKIEIPFPQMNVHIKKK
ncbi:MAG: mechanosensitive ion channel family protein [archaeon]